MLPAVLLAAIVLPAKPAVAQAVLEDFEFWRTSAGWWQSENTYFDRNLDVRIPSFSSLVHIELDGRTFRQTERRAFSPGEVAMRVGRGLTTTGEGIETVTVTVGELVDQAGTVRITQLQPTMASEGLTEIRVLERDTAVRVTHDASTGLDTYRIFITLPTPERRYIANFGLVSRPGLPNAADDAESGDLRGFSLYRAERVESAEAGRWLAILRERHKVAAVVETDARGETSVKRLDDRR